MKNCLQNGYSMNYTRLTARWARF